MRIRSWGILKNSMYILFSIFLLCNCYDSPKKDPSVRGAANDTNNHIPKGEALGIKKGQPHVYTVSISEMTFHPKAIKVHKGDTIIWINHDLVAHCVTEVSNKPWTSSAIPSGRSWKMVVIQSSDYYCAIHPVMKGKIVAE
jgi:plastocyanin